MAMLPLDRHRYNFLVAIEYRGEVVSGGTLLQMNVVLTSAVHMLQEQEDYTVYTNRHNMTQPFHLGWGRALRIKTVHVHPQYRRTHTRFNFAIVKLDRRVDTHVKVILDTHNRADEKNRSLAMLGWGVGTGTRLDTPVGIVGRILPSKECLGYNGKRRNRRSEFCLTRSPAVLDSGSPAIAFNRQGIPVIVGIASWAFPFEVSEAPPSFAMVDPVVSWMTRTIADPNAPSNIPPIIVKTSPLIRAT